MSYTENQLSGLIVLSQKGDKKSYKSLLVALLPFVTKMIQKKVFNENDVSDVVQEVMISIHKSLPTYDAKRDVMPWVYTITQRRVIDYIRKVSRRATKEILTADGDVTFFAGETKLELDTESLKVLDLLPEQTRKAITLTKIEGHSTKEAALILGMKENALRTRVSRGMTMLKKRASEGLIDEQ